MKSARSFRLVPSLLAAGVLALAGAAQALPAAADDVCVQPPAAGQFCPLDDHHSWHDVYDAAVPRLIASVLPI